MRHFCTYFDHRYLPRGLALHASLKKHCKDGFSLWALAMNDQAYEGLQKLAIPEIRPIRLADFEAGDAPLAAAKQNRRLVEYYFTCTPSLPLYVLKQDPSIDVINYVDADLYFFSDPGPLYQDLEGHSVAIIGHRYPPALKDREKFGLYNVGLLMFRRDENGLAVLNWWRDRCNEWCYDHYSEGRFADQKYLDYWQGRFPGVIEIKRKGANTAPWNLANYTVRTNGRRVMIDDEQLIFFHFHGFKNVGLGLYDLGIGHYAVQSTPTLIRAVFAPYAQALDTTTRYVYQHLPDFRTAKKLVRTSDMAPTNVPLYNRLRARYHNASRIVTGIACRNYVPVVRGRML